MLQRIGKDNKGNVKISKLVNKLFIPLMQCHVTFSGRGVDIKWALKGSQILKVITDAALSSSSALTEMAVIREIQSYLRFACHRKGGLGKDHKASTSNNSQ